MGYFHAQWRAQQDDRKDKGLRDSGSGERERTVYRNLYCADGSGTLLVWRRRSEILSGPATQSIRRSVEPVWRITLEELEFRISGKRKRLWENTFCTPFLGYPYYSCHDTRVHNDYHTDDHLPQRSFYRWHLPDPILFEKGSRR